jgi:hypothetical protein
MQLFRKDPNTRWMSGWIGNGDIKQKEREGERDMKDGERRRHKHA